MSDAARLLWIALDGPEIDDEAAGLLGSGVGGVVLFSRNITGVDQLRRLTAALRERAPGPLRIAIDHEGGHVARIGAPLTRFPSAMAVAATGSEELAEACARAAARELSWLGIDVNLAPVLDVAVDPRNPSTAVRTFGSDPSAVARFGAATVRGYRAGGVAATAKHFPGHGRTEVDSHAALPVVEGGSPALHETDLPPFRAAIEAGAELVMASHVAYDGLTDGLPASLSPRALGDLLRDELGFDGLAVTDALNMRAVADQYAPADASVRAVVAGADAVMPLVDQPPALIALEAAAADGRISPARLAAALRRADALETRLAAVPHQPITLPDPDHAALAFDVARRSLTLLAGRDALPLAPGTRVAVVEFATRRPSPIEEATPGGESSLASQLERSGLRVTGEDDAEIVILATRDAYLYPEDRDLVARHAAEPRPTILAALRNPIDLAVLPPTTVRIAAYADVPATLRALAEALSTDAGFPGTLPARLPQRQEVA